MCVADFGAKGDGCTNDAPAIQAAIDSLPATGGVVSFPAGGFWKLADYAASGGPSDCFLEIDKPSVTLEGVGVANSATFLLTDDSSRPAILVRPPVSGQPEKGGTGATLRNLGIGADPGPQATPYAGGNAAVVVNAPQFTADRISIYKYAWGLSLLSGDFTVESSRFEMLEPTTGVGIYINMQGQTETGLIDHCFFKNEASANAKGGIVIEKGAAVQIANCEILKMGHPLWCISDTNRPVRSVAVHNTYFDTSDGSGVLIAGPLNDWFRFSNCWFGSCSYGLQILQGSRMGGLILNGCEFMSNVVGGIVISPDVELHAAVISNSIFAGNGVDVSIGNNVQNFTVTGCRSGPVGCFSASGAGLQIGTGCNRYVVTSNQLASFTNQSSGASNKAISSNILGSGPAPGSCE